MEYDKHEKIIRGMKRDSFLQKPTSSLITIITQFYPVDMNAQICLSHTQKEICYMLKTLLRYILISSKNHRKAVHCGTFQSIMNYFIITL